MTAPVAAPAPAPMAAPMSAPLPPPARAPMPAPASAPPPAPMAAPLPSFVAQPASNASPSTLGVKTNRLVDLESLDVVVMASLLVRPCQPYQNRPRGRGSRAG